MTLERKKLGAAGESAAARMLRRSGYRIVAKNYRCVAGEIDIVARSGKGTEAFFGECRLSAGKVDRALLHGLRQKAAQVPWARAVKKAHYGVFTIGRVSPTIRAEAKALDITLWEL